LYANIAGDEALLAMLEQVRNAKTAMLQREARLTEIGHEALTTGLLQLPKLGANEIIEIGLFDPALPQFAAHRFADDMEHRALHRKLGLRLVEPERGRMQVLYDAWTGPTWANNQRGELLLPHTRGVIGIPGDDDFEPVLSVRAPLMYRVGDAETMPPQLVGYVVLGTGEVVLGA
jgi:hypothetical protein